MTNTTWAWLPLLGKAALAGALASGLSGCCIFGGKSPPASQFPNGQAALDRMKASFDCARGVRGEGKLDFKADRGRLRGNLMFYAVEPQNVRFDVISPFGVALATLTSDGQRFAFNDLREKKFLEGPASTCNIARLTQVPIPGHALVRLMHGEAPLLVHQPEQPTIEWQKCERGGSYLVTIPSTRDAQQRVRLTPHPDDFNKPWNEQRVRVLDVWVEQQSIALYHAEFDDFKVAPMAEPIVDEDDPTEPPVPVSGPQCSVEVPRRIHVSVSATDDVLFRYEDIKMNPPLPAGIFTQPIPGGVQRVPVGECDRLVPPALSSPSRPSSRAVRPLLSPCR